VSRQAGGRAGGREAGRWRTACAAAVDLPGHRLPVRADTRAAAAMFVSIGERYGQIPAAGVGHDDQIWDSTGAGGDNGIDHNQNY
jgi:hypothetical protein